MDLFIGPTSYEVYFISLVYFYFNDSLPLYGTRNCHFHFVIIISLILDIHSPS